MRIAIAFSGHLRSFQQCGNSIAKNIIAPLNADVFVSTYQTVGHYAYYDRNTVRMSTHSVLNDIRSLFAPKLIQYNSAPSRNFERYRKYLSDARSHNSVLSMFEKEQKGLELVKAYEQSNNVKYDVLIRMRPDVFVENQISISDVENSINDGCLYVPAFAHFYGINDQFAFGRYDIMETYFSLFSNIDNLVGRCKFIPEHLLKLHLIDHKIKVKQTDIQYFIQRVSGERTDQRGNNLPFTESWA